jgi:hypothetical protein
MAAGDSPRRSRNVHLNPVRRGLVERRWSSAGWFEGEPKNDLRPDPVPRVVPLMSPELPTGVHKRPLATRRTSKVGKIVS